MKKISVILPIYNVEKYIKECVLSVFEQDYGNIELVAVDDCATDKSIEILQSLYSVSPSHVDCKLYRHLQNKGLSAARNTGIKHATGECILFLDSDDKLMPHCISHLVSKMEETDADVVIYDFLSDGKNNHVASHLCSPIPMLDSNEKVLSALANCWFTVTAWSKLVKKSFIEDNRLYFREGILNEDAPWTFQLCLCAGKVAFLNEKLYYYRYNQASIMTSSKKQRVNESNVIALQIFYDEINKRPNLWENKDIYTIFMRQVVIYFTMTVRQFGFGFYMNQIKMLKSLRYDSSWFNSRRIPNSYKVWNFAYKLPAVMAGVITYMLIKIQNK